ncbi:MAG: ATP-binding protein [Candidatus Dormibacteria bacterium]|jgi:signal transduction histidine kinase
MKRLGAVLTAVRRAWGWLGLRWQLVVLNAVVIAATVATIVLLMHHIAEPSFMSIVHAAGQPVDPAAGQRAYDAAVAAEVYPTIAIGALVAVLLNFLFVTLALRPLRAVTESMASGAAPAPIESLRRDEIGDIAESVNELARSLKRLEDLRRQVTNDVAHELRTPLHNLLGLLEGMRDGVMPASSEQLDRAHHELRRLIALVEDLRALSDAQLARDRMDRRPLDLVALLRDTIGGFAPAMAGRSLTGNVESHGWSPTVLGDRVRLAQVVGNVIDNAIRHAAPGTTITALVVPGGDEAVRVGITDVGDVIAPEALPYLFERFFRVDPSRARGSGGAGIGLAIVRELVDAHGGNVGASSDARGVTVWFELPVAQADAVGMVEPWPRDQRRGAAAPAGG